MVSLVCGRHRTGFPRFSQAGRYQKHYRLAEPRRDPLPNLSSLFRRVSVGIRVLRNFTITWYHITLRQKRQALSADENDYHPHFHRRHAQRSTYIIHEPVEKASAFCLSFIVFHNRHSTLFQSKWQALSIHESVTQGPLYLFFSMCPLYRFLVKWQALFCLRFCLPFLWIHV